ncbi:MAG: 1-deoxy-D-xylulose-5-phosphate reductoisomerase [Pseudomonadota bacterium]
MRKVSVFGSTGSIGVNTVDLLLRQGGREAFDVVALSGARNVDLLAEQAKALGARMAITAVEACYQPLKDALAGTDITVAAGVDALAQAAGEPADWTMSAIVGSAGLRPGLEALKTGATLALANKESLVCAGALVKASVAEHGGTLLPVDSEHSAIFQCLEGYGAQAFERIILTASGGPFREWSVEDMAQVTPAQAKAHPNWSMGARISIDSATMFNKALEMIEAQVLFNAMPEQIEVIVHPQSIIHSMVGFADGAIMAQLGPSDMRGAIGYALNHPDRAPLPVERLNFAQLGALSFQAPDPDRFPALRLAREVMDMGGLAGAVFNGAKECALDEFLKGSIGFLDMARLVAHVMDTLGPEAAQTRADYDLDDVLHFDSRARETGLTWAERKS